MKVFKFGGASVNSVERIKNVGNIINLFNNDNLMIIISAMGKTTNALEKVAESFYEGDKQTALDLFNTVKQSHLQTAKYLLGYEVQCMSCNSWKVFLPRLNGC